MAVNTSNAKLGDLNFYPYNIVATDWDSFTTRSVARASIVCINDSIVLYLSATNFESNLKRKEKILLLIEKKLKTFTL